LGKLFTPICLDHQPVLLDTGQGAVMFYGWEANPQAWRNVMAAYRRVDGFKSPAG